MANRILRVLTVIFIIGVMTNLYTLHGYYKLHVSRINYIETANSIMED